jgi:uncharacterized membrane protein YgcG
LKAPLFLNPSAYQVRNEEIGFNFCFQNSTCTATPWLLQHGTKLYMVKARQLAKELFYQRVVARFGALPRRALAEPAPIAEMVRMALEAEEEEEEGAEGAAGAAGAGGAEAVAEAIAALLVEKAPLLREYFAVDIDEDARALVGLPVVVEGHHPDITRLPEFIISLAHEVDWSAEKECFHTISAAIADFYGGGGGGDSDGSGGGGGGDGGDGDAGDAGGAGDRAGAGAPLPPPSEALAAAEAASAPTAAGDDAQLSQSHAWSMRHVVGLFKLNPADP